MDTSSSLPVQITSTPGLALLGLPAQLSPVLRARPRSSSSFSTLGLYKAGNRGILTPGPTRTPPENDPIATSGSSTSSSKSSKNLKSTGTSFLSVGLVFRLCPKILASRSTASFKANTSSSLNETSQRGPPPAPSTDSWSPPGVQNPCTERSLSSSTNFREICEHEVPSGPVTPTIGHHRTLSTCTWSQSPSGVLILFTQLLPGEHPRLPISFTAGWLLSQLCQIVQYTCVRRIGRKRSSFVGRRKERTVSSDDGICVACLREKRQWQTSLEPERSLSS